MNMLNAHACPVKGCQGQVFSTASATVGNRVLWLRCPDHEPTDSTLIVPFDKKREWTAL